MGKLFKSLSIFSLMTMLSRLTGLVRELTLAYFLGASAMLDLFWIVYRIPNFLRKLFAEGALSQAMIPVLSTYQTSQSITQEFKTFLNQMFSWMLLVLAIVVVAAQFFAPYLIWLFAPGIARDAERFRLSVKLIRIMFPTLLFISLAAYSGSILNSYRQFGVPAFAQNWLNITLVTVACFFGHQDKIIYLQALAWGVFISGVLQWLFQLPNLMQLHVIPKLEWPRFNFGVRQVMTLMLPAIFGISVSQINLLVDTFLVSFLPSGSLSWLNYADRLASLPLGVVGVALATVILPQLSNKNHEHDLPQFITTIQWALYCMLLVALPCMLILQLLAEPIVATLFQRGAFGIRDTLMTARALRCLAFGVPAFMAVKILAAGFYAQLDLKTPVKIAALAVLTNAFLATWFSHYWQHAGIALATAFSSYLNACLLGYKLRQMVQLKTKHARPLAQSVNNQYGLLFKLGIALSVLVGVILVAKSVVIDWHTMSNLTRVIRLAIIIVAALVSYLMTLLAMRMPLRELFRA